jgi:hypothetical protein
MEAGGTIVRILHDYVHEIIVSAILAIAGSAAMWPVRKISKAYEEAIEKLDAVHTELTTQRENCLSSLQRQGDVQIEVLKEVSSTLKDMHLDQRTLLGKLDK